MQLHHGMNHSRYTDVDALDHHEIFWGFGMSHQERHRDQHDACYAAPPEQRAADRAVQRLQKSYSCTHGLIALGITGTAGPTKITTAILDSLLSPAASFVLYSWASYNNESKQKASMFKPRRRTALGLEVVCRLVIIITSSTCSRLSDRRTQLEATGYNFTV